MAYTFYNVAPIGDTNIRGSIVNCRSYRVGHTRVAVYPPSPNGARLRELRISLGFSLRQAAIAMELRSCDLSDLEMGRKGLSVLSDWTDAEARLRNAATIGRQGGGR